MRDSDAAALLLLCAWLITSASCFTYKCTKESREHGAVNRGVAEWAESPGSPSGYKFQWKDDKK